MNEQIIPCDICGVGIVDGVDSMHTNEQDEVICVNCAAKANKHPDHIPCDNCGQLLAEDSLDWREQTGGAIWCVMCDTNPERRPQQMPYVDTRSKAEQFADGDMEQADIHIENAIARDDRRTGSKDAGNERLRSVIAHALKSLVNRLAKDDEGCPNFHDHPEEAAEWRGNTAMLEALHILESHVGF